MKKRYMVFLGILMVFVFNCTSNESSKKEMSEMEKGQVKAEKTTKKGKLLFFMNPNGRPCQMQDDILKEREISNKTNLVYIKTSVPDDRQKFYQYGVRGLPMIILLDENDKIVKRFAPGIRSYQELEKEIAKL